MLSLWQSLSSLLPQVLLHKTTLSHMRLAQHSKGWLQDGLGQDHHPFQCIQTSSCVLSPGQSKGCLLESLTASNCWLEVLIKRRGQEAAWERLHEAQVPDDLLAAFVQETHQAKAIPIPGESQSDMNPWFC